MAGAKIAATSDAGVRRETHTGNNGRYTFLCSTRAYRLEMNQSGFATSKLEGIVVKITETTVADVRLKVATQATTLSVTGESPLVQTESSARGSVIDEQQCEVCRCRPATSSNC